MNSPTFHIDFFSDWIALLKNDLASLGYSTADLSDEKVQIAYFNAKKRLIEPIKRNVLKSREFTCPPERAVGLQRLEQEIKNGNDLRPYLSKFILDIDYNDNLLNHWGIYHLHLGDYIEATGFIKREGPVLYVRFDKTNAYFIDVRGHNSWSEQSLIQVIHDNWPQTIAAFRYPNSIRLAYDATDDDVSKLRKAKINSPVGVSDGTVYGVIGGGAALNGVSSEVVSLMLNAKEKISNWQKSIEANVENIVNDALSKGITFSEWHEVNLDFEGSKAYAVEKNNLFYFELGML
jgi:hypothetical protein